MEQQRTSGAQRRKYKRADISTEVVLACILAYGYRAFEVLSETFPEKVVMRAIQRDGDKGYVEFGASQVRGWLTPEGEAFIRRERYKCIV